MDIVSSAANIFADNASCLHKVPMYRFPLGHTAQSAEPERSRQAKWRQPRKVKPKYAVPEVAVSNRLYPHPVLS